MPNYDEITKSAYREMELHLISSMKRNLGLHIAEEIKTGKEYPQWQAIKLRELRKYQKENRDIIKRSVGSFPEDVAKQLESELKQGAVQEQHRYNIAKGVTMDTAMGEGFFRLNRNKLEALQKSVNNDLSKANNAVLRMMNDTYRSTIYKYELFLANGVYTPTQAYDAAVKDFLERGINCIEYKDGRRVNIADYTDMAIKTANKRAQLMGEGSFRKSIGNPLIIMSAHNTSCKLCKPFQNKVLIDDVYSGGTQEDGDYMLLSEAMERGLYHPRCKHGCGTYYPEIEHINQYETPENKLNDYGDKIINAAHIDNMIQRYKRLVAGSVDKNNIEKYQQQLKLWEQEREKYNDLYLKMANENIENDWSETTIHNISRKDKQAIIKYAEDKGIKISNLKDFDGDIELLKSEIDILQKISKEIPLRKKIVLSVSKSLPDADFASTIENHITLNAKALRNRSITEKNIKLGGIFSSSKAEDIIVHEYGHVFMYEKGNKGIEISCKVYYNMNGKKIDIDNMLVYLEDNISSYSVIVEKQKYKEIIPEVLAKHNSNPDEFTKLFIKLLKE